MTRTIQPEDRIAHYRVVGPLGSGGMGEVYLADDQKLERSVALKVLPFALVRDEERVRRFVREAKSASSLNHPNIVTIYEIGHEQIHAAGDEQPVSDPIHFISMELVTGETLGDKIRSQKTDIKTLLGYLTQAAEGVAKAHSAGIVHRDLKPSNIMISQDGYAKVLDFGLAKLIERRPDSGDLSSPTVPLHATESGQALGTVGYMSPEQIRGGKVDHRSDIFSFGCVLYECVTGQRAFHANTDVETLHHILHEDPTQVEELSPHTPDALRRLIKRCLARNPDRRLQSMKDLAIELQEIVDEYEKLPPTSGSSAVVGSGGQPTVGRRRVPPVVLGGVAMVGVVGLVLGMKALLGGSSSEPTLSSPAQPRVTGILGDVSNCTLSADGKYLAYAVGLRGVQGLWIRQLATGSSAKLSDAIHGTVDRISFSPDGSYVYFGSPRVSGSGLFEIYRIPSLGGSPQRVLADVDSRLSFSPDGSRACFRRVIPGTSATTDVVIVDLDTGEERVLWTVAGFVWSPAWSPSGDRVAGIHRGPPDSLVIIDVATGDHEPLGPGWGTASSCTWLPEDRGVIVAAGPPGEAQQIWHVSYPEGVVRRVTGGQDEYSDVTVTSDGSMLAARREIQSANLWSAPLAGAPVPRQLTRSTAGTGGIQPFLGGVVDDGSIVAVWEGQLRLLDGEGSQIRSITSPSHVRSGFALVMPGGVLFTGSAPGGGRAHIWHVDLAGGALTQLTSGPGEYLMFSLGSVDGFLYQVWNNQREVFIGSVGEMQPRKAPGSWPSEISPDGKWIYTTEHDPSGTSRRIVVRSIETLEPQLEFDMTYSSAVAWTPGSDAVAHVISTGEGQQIVLQPMDGGEPRLLLEITPARLDTSDPRRAFRWSSDGGNLCLRFWEDGASNFWVVPSAGGELRPITDFRTGLIYDWKWAPDGKSVYFTRGNPVQDAVLIHDFE